MSHDFFTDACASDPCVPEHELDSFSNNIEILHKNPDGSFIAVETQRFTAFESEDSEPELISHMPFGVERLRFYR